MKKWLFIALWLVFSLSLAGVQPAFADMIWVDAAAASGGDGSSDHPFKTIQAGISAATDGDIVSVIKGTYVGDIVMKNGILVQTWFGRRATIVGSSQGPVVRSIGLDDTTTLSGFNIRGGNGSTGGGIELIESSMTVRYCGLSENSADFGGGIYIGGASSAPYILECDFSSNNATIGGGHVAIVDGADPVFRSCEFIDGESSAGGAVLGRQTSAATANQSPSFTQCSFSANHAERGGAGYFIGGTGDYKVLPEFDRCRFEENTADLFGGGLYTSSSLVRFSVFNSIFQQNMAGNTGHAIYCAYGKPQIHTTVFFQNSSADGGSGVHFSHVSLYSGLASFVRNSIFFQNEPQEIEAYDVDRLYIEYNLIEGGFEGTGNINADPMFRNPLEGDFRLDPDSPCIDSGSENPWALPDYDFDGNTRVVDGDGDGTAIVDMGIYEYAMPETVYVDDDWDGLGDGTDVGYKKTIGINAFSTIQEGIDAVDTPGTVIVSPGSYSEHITLKSGVMVEGDGDADSGYVHLHGDSTLHPTVRIPDCTSGTTGLNEVYLYGASDAFPVVTVSDSSDIY